MALRKATPLKLSPVSASDALDSTNLPMGMMAALQNLIPDPTTPNLWECRPASIKLADFNTEGPFSSGWSSGFQHSPFGPGVTSAFISVLLVIGTRAYGMIATSQYGTDVPFSYNLLTNTFDTITGVTAANTPVSPAATGAWTPPTMAIIGSNIIVTHPGFNFSGGFAFGVLNVATPTSPTWTAQNTGTNSLAALPSFVINFNQRAYFLVNIPNGQPGAYFSDVLNALNITNANQILTFDDNQQLTAAAGLGLFNQLGGIVQSLIIFKNTANMYQITGDALLSNLTRNSLNVATGTAAPNSVTNTPNGLAFLAPDGLRLIDFDARIGNPIGVDGQGINAPFINAVVPSRVNICCNQNVLRASLQNGGAAGAPIQEWWYDISRGRWSGPHTFPASMIEPYEDTFIMTPVSTTGNIWRSDVVQSLTSTFVENGNQMTFNWMTSFLPDSGQMSEYQVSETVLNMSPTSEGGPITIEAITQQGSVLGSVIIAQPGAPPLWGQFDWGQVNWGGLEPALSYFQLPWTQPLVFSRMQLQVTGNCAQGVKIGDLYLRYQQTGYIQSYVGAA
jgi:hypothetical protein